MTMNTSHEDEINNEVNKIIINNWSFLDYNWPIISYEYKHRTEIKHIKNIKEIKKELVKKLGYISVFFFLVVLYTSKEYPAPYFEVEKGLFLLYHLVSGVSGIDINKFLPQSSFHKYYKKFWMDEDNYKRINKIINDSLENMFSSIRLRILSAYKHNPPLFKHVTLIIDGHDSRINYVDTDIKRERLFSYKFKKNGIRTQIISDVNDMIIYISKSDFCADSSDGSMFLNMKLYRKINSYDVLATDGGYTLFINQLIDLSSEKGFNLNNNNFIYPIRKEVNLDLSSDERHFNDVFGSFRSKIEAQFSDIGNKFLRFSNSNSTAKIDNIKFYNLQFKTACLLKNIQKFVEIFNINIQSHHKLWESDNFEFPFKEKLIDIVISNSMEQSKRKDEMLELQKSFLEFSIDNNMIIDEFSDDSNNDNNKLSSDEDVPKFNEKKRKRKKKGKQKVISIDKIRNISKNNSYEVEKIVNHVFENNNYKFLIKWKDYSDVDNTWITLEQFNEKDMLNKYMKEHNLV